VWIPGRIGALSMLLKVANKVAKDVFTCIEEILSICLSNLSPHRLLFFYLYGLYPYAGKTFVVKIKLLGSSDAQINDPFS
jgi:hypothetical protein